MNNTNTVTDRAPTPQELAPLAGLINGEINRLNQSVIEDNSRLKAAKITAETLNGQPLKLPSPPMTTGSHVPPPGVTHHPPQSSQANNTQQPVITFDVLKFEKNVDKNTKTINTLKKKITDLTKEVDTLKTIISFEHTRGKYTIVTDNVNSTCNNTDSLINILLKELQSKSKNITINKE